MPHNFQMAHHTIWLSRFYIEINHLHQLVHNTLIPKPQSKALFSRISAPCQQLDKIKSFPLLFLLSLSTVHQIIMVIKVYRYTFRGSNCHLHICFPSQEGFTLKGRNLLLLEPIPSLKGKLQFIRAILTREANMKSQKLSPFVNMAETRTP